jgi:hypothetical protein
LQRAFGQYVQHSSGARREPDLAPLAPKLAGSHIEAKRTKGELPFRGHGPARPRIPGNFPELARYFRAIGPQIVARGSSHRNQQEAP